MRLLRAALESEIDTTPVKEKEYVFYGKIKNFEQLKQASSMAQHEQYELKIPKTEKNGVEGKIRIRKIIEKDTDPVYILTTKTKTSDGHHIEVSCETTEQNLLQFQYMADHGMIKDRYTFPVEGHEQLTWEIDVFKAANGSYHEWCKIDLEYDDSLHEIPTFPIELDSPISAPYGQRTDEEEQMVRTLYDTVFRVPNPVNSPNQIHLNAPEKIEDTQPSKKEDEKEDLTDQVEANPVK